MHRATPLLILAMACSEFGLGGGADPDGLSDGQGDGSDGPGGDGPGGDGSGADPFEPFPGEQVPPGWPEWDDACGRWSSGGGGGAGTERYTVDEPVEALTVLLGVGDLDIVPRPGPVEVVLHGVRPNGSQGPTVSGGELTLDYGVSVGDLTVYSPPDLLSYDFRVCVGDLSFAELGGHVVAEVRTGAVDGHALVADRAWIHNRTGDGDVRFAAPPAEVWLEGSTGNFDVNVPAPACDCDLEVSGAGLATLDGIVDDPSAPLSVWARRRVGTIGVRGE